MKFSVIQSRMKIKKILTSKNIRISINDKWKPHLVFAIIAFLLYGNTLNNGFVYDDAVVLTHNSFTQNGIKGIPDILKYDTFAALVLFYQNDLNEKELKEKTNFLAGGRYRPLSLVTFALEIEFFGKDYQNEPYKGNTFVSHLGNIILYLFTCCLLFLILQKQLSSRKNKKWYLTFPFIATLLFLTHPIHTEVVANIKSRDEIMALLGSLGALWFTVKYMDNNKFHNLVLSGLCLFLGLLSKENAITFLAIIPVSLFYFRNSSKRMIIRSMIPLIIVSVLFLWIRARVIGDADRPEVLDLLNNPFVNATTGEFFATIFFTLFLYVKLLFFPHPLTSDYYPFHIEIVNWTNPVVLVSLLFYLGIGTYAVYGMIKKRDVISWSIWLYLFPLSIVSNLFFPVGAFMGERFIFFSSLGFATFIGWIIVSYVPRLAQIRQFSILAKADFKFLSRFSRGRRIMQYSNYITVALLVIILCFYSIKTISRNSVWKDNFTLFTTDVKTSKNSTKANYEAGNSIMQKFFSPDNFSDAKNRNQYLDEAMWYLKRAAKLYPQYSNAYELLGLLYLNRNNDIAQALHYYAISLFYPTLRSSTITIITKEILNMTNILLDDKQIISTPEEILQSCDELLYIRPDIGEALFVKGVIYGKYLHNLELALSCLEQALAMDFPKTVRFYEYLGAAYGMSGNFTDALQYLLKAVEMGTDDIDTYINLSIIYRQLGDMENAGLYASKGNEIKKMAEK